MIRAYHKVYLEKARTNLGRMLDFATYDLGYNPSGFFDLFMNCGLAERFGKGEFTLTAGMSGVELAEASGVPVRTIQQYEQRQKSINKAQAEYLMMLARALHCNAEALIEPVE